MHVNKTFANIKSTITPFVLVCIIASVSFVNSAPAHFITWGGDTVYPIDLDIYIENIGASWVHLNYGYPNLSYAYVTYYYAYYILVKLFGFAGANAFWLLFAVPAGLSFYYATRSLFDNPIKNLLFALVYVYNPYTLYLFEYTWIFSPFCFLYTILPLQFHYLIKLTDNKSISLVDAGVYGLVCVGMSISYGNFPFFAAMFLLLNVFLITLRAQSEITTGKLLTINLIFLVSSSWSIVGQVQGLLDIVAIGEPSSTQMSLADWVKWQSLSFKRAFYLDPKLDALQPQYIIRKLHRVWFVLLLLSAFFIKKPYRLAVVAVYVVSIIILNKGSGYLPDSIVGFFFANPILGVFRSYDKVLPIAIGMLFFFGLPNIGRIRYLSYIYVLINFVVVYPFLTGQIQKEYTFAGDRGSGFSYVVPAPEGLVEAVRKVNMLTDNNDCIYTFPYTATNSYGWSTLGKLKLIGVDPLRYSVRAQSIAMDIKYGDFNLDSYFKHNGYTIANFLEINKSFACKYIVNNNFADNDSVVGYDSLVVDGLRNRILDLVYSNGGYSIYNVVSAGNTSRLSLCSLQPQNSIDTFDKYCSPIQQDDRGFFLNKTESKNKYLRLPYSYNSVLNIKISCFDGHDIVLADRVVMPDGSIGFSVGETFCEKNFNYSLVNRYTILHAWEWFLGACIFISLCLILFKRI